MERDMKLTIFAATGRIGRHVLEQAGAAGHDVTAVVRNPARLAGADADVRVVTADLADPDPEALKTALHSAVEGADAVLSGLGPRSQSEAGITAPGTRAIVDAMKATDVRRIVVVSAAPLSTVPSPARPNPPRHDPGEGFVTRYLLTPMIKTVLRKHYADLALMEDILLDSGLDWTVVRPPKLTDKPLTGTYRTAYGRNLRRGTVIPRADVAHLMLDVLERPDTIGQAIGIAS
jgi:putative NADH-flavin reductase